jgi:predicted CopG family antitoxin
MGMAASETKIPVSRDVRKELRMVKARKEKHSYNDAIRHLLKQRED